MDARPIRGGLVFEGWVDSGEAGCRMQDGR